MNEHEIIKYLKDLLRTHHISMHSPNYTVPCSKTCPVCNMDKKLYTMVRQLVKN